jgi:hypothetical protein
VSGSGRPGSARRHGLRLRRLLLLAPLVFVAHFLEEGPGFVAWFNEHVARGITPELFRSVNYSALGITIVVVALEWVSESRVSAAVAVAWLGFLMLANALFHIAATLADGAYTPGVVTAVLLYLPFYTWVLSRVLGAGRLPVSAVVAAAVAGAMPMLIHGYLIVFRGTRLF